MNINNMSKADIQAFIENFNKDFSVKLKNDDTTFLIDLFENFVNLSMSAAKGGNLDKLVDLEDEINATYNKRDKKLFDRWNKMQDNLFSKEIQQAFVYGVCVYKRLDEETKSVGGENNE